jgi:hypothetical protein
MMKNSLRGTLRARAHPQGQSPGTHGEAVAAVPPRQAKASQRRRARARPEEVEEQTSVAEPGIKAGSSPEADLNSRRGLAEIGAKGAALRPSFLAIRSIRGGDCHCFPMVQNQMSLARPGGKKADRRGRPNTHPHA